MLPKYDIKKLENAIYDFNCATGISITLYDPDETPITMRGSYGGEYCKLVAKTKEGARVCGRSNRALIAKCRETKEVVRHICGAGLLDIAIPLLHRDEIVGFLMIGQIRKTETLPKDTLAIRNDDKKMQQAYNNLPIYNDQMIESIINIATMLTKYIMFENLVKSNPKQSAAVVADYIDAHLTEKLSVDLISKGTHISVSGIYKCMKNSYNCTLGEYICIRRIERSLSILDDSDISIEKIAETVGFSDAAYYSRCFKKIYGVSPLKYRKTQNRRLDIEKA